MELGYISAVSRVHAHPRSEQVVFVQHVQRGAKVHEQPIPASHRAPAAAGALAFLVSRFWDGVPFNASFANLRCVLKDLSIFPLPSPTYLKCTLNIYYITKQ